MKTNRTIDTSSNLSSRQAWAMLLARTILFATLQALFALGFALSGSAHAWDDSAAWWPFTVTLTNFICISLLMALFRKEGKNYWNFFHFDRKNVKNDLLVFLGVLVIAVPIAMLPNVLLAKWLFGDTQGALPLFIRHLPAWAAYSGFVLFPITQGLAELSTYFLYVEPRLEKSLNSRWLAVSLASLTLGIQHVAVPLVFNGSFILWRSLMFIPFAFLLGVVLRRRPRLFPYLAILHVLLDMATAAMLLPV
jgi:hypothetical protein